MKLQQLKPASKVHGISMFLLHTIIAIQNFRKRKWGYGGEWCPLLCSPIWLYVNLIDEIHSNGYIYIHKQKKCRVIQSTHLNLDQYLRDVKIYSKKVWVQCKNISSLVHTALIPRVYTWCLVITFEVKINKSIMHCIIPAKTIVSHKLLYLWKHTPT